jgi:nondiscriminating glutamyl-tRNA synthetase
MSNRQVRVRFAPSPTGHLHVGGARTAIFNWLFARHHDGVFVVRIEDTDVARSTRKSERMVLDDLRWLGLDWDEGPDIGGSHAPYRQSERFDLYRDVAATLLDKGMAYHCFCREEELEQKRKAAEEEGRPPHYDLTCYRLGGEEVEQRIARKEPFVVRFHVLKEGNAAFDADVTIDDLIRGEVTWRKESLGDFILLRSDGMPTYNFCVVVDDHTMEISHVIRAEEHLTNTHRQVLIYRALEWEVPLFAHVSLILGQDRSKLSKRHGATSVAAYAEEGFLPDAMLNYLTLLGWSPPDGEELFDRQKAASLFSLERVNSAPAVFDPQKFLWMNGQYLHALAPGELRSLVEERLVNAGYLAVRSEEAIAWLDDVSDLLRKSLSRLSDFVPALHLFFEFDPGRILRDPEVMAVLSDPEAVRLLELLLADLHANGAPTDSEEYHAMADRLKKESGLKGKKLFMPMRVAFTGQVHGPELHRVVPLLEKGSAIEGVAPIVPPLQRVERLHALVGGSGE